MTAAAGAARREARAMRALAQFTAGVVLAAGLAVFPSAAPAGAADVTLHSCDEAQFRAAVVGGRTVSSG